MSEEKMEKVFTYLEQAVSIGRKKEEGDLNDVFMDH